MSEKYLKKVDPGPPQFEERAEKQGAFPIGQHFKAGGLIQETLSQQSQYRTPVIKYLNIFN